MDFAAIFKGDNGVRRDCTLRRDAELGIGCVKLRPGGMSIDVALSTRRDVGRDTYSLPQKRGCAASGTSMGEAA